MIHWPEMGSKIFLSCKFVHLNSRVNSSYKVTDRYSTSKYYEKTDEWAEEY